MNQTKLKRYARLIARMGVNIRRGQEAVIQAEVDCPDFVVLLTEACYRAGASAVRVEWSYQALTPLHVKYRTEESLGRVESWDIDKLVHRRDALPCRIILLSEDPDGLAGMDQGKWSRARQSQYRYIKPYRDAVENKEQWCIAAVPGRAWAKKVFPNLTEKQAIEALWDAILKASRADGADPIRAWKEHNADLLDRSRYLNGLGIESLHYRASNGTDFTVGMMDEGLFMGGEEKTLGSGIFFNPNIPSEEVFTTPMRGKAQGVVYASKPYSYRGSLIEGIRLVFENGKVTDCRADTNEELLKKMISMDEGAAYLGECALVPYHSPISESGILFYNTLFDENAACHIALGAGFANCLRGFEKLSLEQCREKGVNESMIHEDLMIGTPDLSVTAKTKDGNTVEIFRNGDWAF